MLNLNGIKSLGCRIIQVLIHHPDFIPHHTVIDGNSINKFTAVRHKTNNFFLQRLSVLHHIPGDLISQQIRRVGQRVAQADLHLVPVICIHLGGDISHRCRRAVGIQGTCSLLQPVSSGLVIGVPDCPGLLCKLSRILDGVGIRRHSPLLKEFQNIFLCRRTGQTHKLLIRISCQGQSNAAGLRCLSRIPGVGVHPGKEQICQLLLIVLISLVVISSVI